MLPPNPTPIDSSTIDDLYPIPVGSMALIYSDFSDSGSDYHHTIKEWSNGALGFRISIEGRHLSFYYTCPSTGTRRSSINFSEQVIPKDFYLLISWSPEKISFGIKDLSNKAFYPGQVTNPDFDLIVARDGAIAQIGGAGVEVFSYKMLVDGEYYVDPPSILLWSQNIKAIRSLLSSSENADNSVNFVLWNASCRHLVSAFETYCKHRMFEMELEGYDFNYDGFSNHHFPQNFIESGKHFDAFAMAKSNRHSTLRRAHELKRITINRISDASDYFKILFDLRIHEIGIPKDALKNAGIMFKHRHELTHHDPLTHVFFDKDGSFLVIDSTYLNTCVESFELITAAIHERSILCPSSWSALNQKGS
jgi:hypothetical protein